MKNFCIVIMLILPYQAMAQSQQQQSTPTEQVFGAKILKELQEGLSCNVNLLTVQVELNKLQARIKELEAKGK